MNWIKRILEVLHLKKKPEVEVRRNYRAFDDDNDEELKELMLLEDPICGKHHG